MSLTVWCDEVVEILWYWSSRKWPDC